MSEEKKKKTGFIRTGAVVPFLIVAIVTTLFSIFLLDGVIKRTLEYVGGRINGAEVNVANVSTSFRNLSVEVEGIEFTNANQPTHNLFEIGKIRFQMMWDAILRAKIVIDESSMTDIKIATQRKSAGEVYPPEESSATSEVAKETFQNAKEEFKGNIFGDVSALLAGDSSKDVLKNIEGELKSKQFYEELEAQVDQKEGELKQMFADLPKGREVDQYDDRFKAIDWNGLKDLKKAPKILKEADDLKDDVQNTVKKYNEAVKRVESEIKFVEDSKKRAEKLIDEDIKALESKMSIPNLDSAAIASVLFGPEFVDSLSKYNKYFEMAKEYMPPKKDSKEVVASKPARGSGRNYQFGTPTSYPMFWLKLANISSENEQGNVSGKIENVTTDQLVINKPTRVELKGNFPPQGVSGVNATAIFDHRQMVNDSIKLSVASFPVTEKALSKSDSVSFIMSKATAATTAEAKLVRDRLTLNLDNTFSNIDYTVGAKTKTVEELLYGVADEAKVVTVNAQASGTIEKLSFKLKTNLAEIIKSAVGKVLQRKITEARDKIKNGIEEKVGANKAKVDQKLAELKSKYKGEIDKQKAKIDQLTGKIDQKKDSAKAGLENKGKDLLKDLKKKFKF